MYVYMSSKSVCIFMGAVKWIMNLIINANQGVSVNVLGEWFGHSKKPLDVISYLMAVRIA